jgi:hypothetical protein
MTIRIRGVVNVTGMRKNKKKPEKILLNGL